MPLTSADINRLRGGSSGFSRGNVMRGYYGFRRGLQTASQMRNLIRRLDKLEAIDHEMAQQLEGVFKILSDVSAATGSVMSMVNMGVASASAWAVHPVLGAAVMALSTVSMIAGGTSRYIDVTFNTAHKYGAIQMGRGEHAYPMFTGPQGGRAQYEKWDKETRWARTLSLFNIRLGG